MSWTETKALARVQEHLDSIGDIEVLSLARQVADVAAIMADGVIIEAGPARDVLTRPEDPRTRKFLAKSLQDHHQDHQ